MYSGSSDLDPTEGRARWHKLAPPGEKKKKTLGALETREYDEKYGRRWHTRKDEEKPKLHTTIGRHARAKDLKRTILRFAYGSRNLKALKRDVYRKRWPKNAQMNIRFFSEFCKKPFAKRTMLETAHTLPLFGRGCKFFRHVSADGEDTRGQSFVVTSARYKLRPIRGLLRGTQYYNGIPALSGVAALGKSLGSWRFEYPENAHPLVFRPAFPVSVAAEKAAMAAAE